MSEGTTMGEGTVGEGAAAGELTAVSEGNFNVLSVFFDAFFLDLSSRVLPASSASLGIPSSRCRSRVLLLLQQQQQREHRTTNNTMAENVAMPAISPVVKPSLGVESVQGVRAGLIYGVRGKGVGGYILDFVASSLGCDPATYSSGVVIVGMIMVGMGMRRGMSDVTLQDGMLGIYRCYYHIKLGR